MPYRVTHSHGPEFKEYGVHNGSQCILKAWSLEPEDIEAFKVNMDPEVILKSLPNTLLLKMLTPLKKPYPGLPEDWFPMKPVTTYWTLDPAENIDIARRGYPLVPNFSSTIHAATGRTMSSAIPDLGDIGALPSFAAAMRGYIGLSRVTAAHKLLLAQPFNPLLFRQGPQPYPTLLMDVLNGVVSPGQITEECRKAAERSRKMLQYKDQVWLCGECGEMKKTNAFVVVRGGDEFTADIWTYVIKCGKKRTCMNCRSTQLCNVCRENKTDSDFTAFRWKHADARKHVCRNCCEGREETYSCDVCGERHGADGFTQGISRKRERWVLLKTTILGVL